VTATMPGTAAAGRPAVPPGWRVARARIGREVPDLPTAPVDDPADPATVVGQYATGSAAEVDAAVHAATAAFPGWAARTAEERAKLLLAAADLLDPLVEQAAAVLVSEVGKVRAEAAFDAGGAPALLRRYAALHAEADAAVVVQDGPARSTLRHRPVGPVAVITPWNSPVYLAFLAVAPALLVGCSVVVKPPEDAPLAVTGLLHALADALPVGVVNVVPGRGPEAGQALAGHPQVRAISFTGGIDTGAAVATAAAATITQATLELGGNDPALVLADATIGPDLLRELVAGAFVGSGQICQNIKRIYVHRSRHAELMAGLMALVARLPVGPGGTPGVLIAPLTTDAGVRRAAELVAAARAAGATVVEGGTAVGDLDRGRFVRPTLVTDLSADHPLVLVEQFCPVLPVVAVDDDEQAIAEANRTEFGLAASVWSDDVAHAEAVAARIEAGTVFVNVHRLGAAIEAVPYGGVKRSGIGRNHGVWSLRACTEPHATVTWTDAATTLPGLARWPHPEETP
jgi:aldehyde dehydrogenase